MVDGEGLVTHGGSATRERGFSVSADRETRGRLEEALAQLREGNGATDARGTLTALIADISRDEHELLEIVREHRHRVRQISAPVFDAQGGVRMGSNPRESVVNKYGQTWDIPNLFVIGSSNFPTSAGFNPTLTIQALAYMSADAIVNRYRKNPGALL